MANIDEQLYEAEESYIKPDTKRNNSTYKLARGRLQVSNRYSNRRWAKNRFASYRNDMKNYTNNDRDDNMPSMNSNARRDIWTSPKDSIGSNGLDSRHEIESYMNKQSDDTGIYRIVYKTVKYNVITEKNVIRALKHGKKKLSYRVYA
jgi:hypothetical protein